MRTFIISLLLCLVTIWMEFAVGIQAVLECLSKIIVFGFAFGANTVVYIHSL